MLTALKVLLLAIQLLPSLLDAIAKVEASMPGSGNGASKLEMISAAAKAAYEVDPTIAKEFPLERVLALIGRMATSAVDLFNRTGVFVKRS